MCFCVWYRFESFQKHEKIFLNFYFKFYCYRRNWYQIVLPVNFCLFHLFELVTVNLLKAKEVFYFLKRFCLILKVKWIWFLFYNFGSDDGLFILLFWRRNFFKDWKCLWWFIKWKKKVFKFWFYFYLILRIEVSEWFWKFFGVHHRVSKIPRISWRKYVFRYWIIIHFYYWMFCVC